MTKLHLIHESLNPSLRGSLYYLAFWSCVGGFAPFINPYFAHLGLSGRQIGVLSTLFPLTMLVMALPLSTLADRRRWRIRTLRLALGGSALTFFLLGIPRSFETIVPFMVLLAIFFTPTMPIGDSLIARMSVRHALNYGGMRLWGSFGFATMAIVCGALWRQVGFEAMFVLVSLLFVPVFWAANWLEEGAAVENQVRRPLSDIGRDSGLVVLLLAAFLVGIAIGLSIVFEGIYMNHLGGSALLIGMLFGVAAFSELPTMQYSSLVARYLRGPGVLLLAYGLMGSAYLGYALAWQPHMLLILAAIKGLGFGLFFTSTVRLLHERTPDEWSATTQAIMTAGMFGLAPLIAGPLGGIVYDLIGPAAVFVIGSVAIGLAAVVLLYAAARGMLA